MEPDRNQTSRHHPPKRSTTTDISEPRAKVKAGVLLHLLPRVTLITDTPNSVGVAFGILSSCTTAFHSIVIKKTLPIVNGSTIDLAWYTNLLSTVVIVPIIFVMGEVPAVMHVLGGGEGAGRFFWGSVVTVSQIRLFGVRLEAIFDQCGEKGGGEGGGGGEWRAGLVPVTWQIGQVCRTASQ